MKKLLVVLLALTFVVSMAVAASAVVTTSVDGKVEWTLTSGDQFGGSIDGKIVFDLAKDFGEGYSAGLKIKLIPGDNIDVVDPDDPDPAPNNKIDVDKASAVAYDGDGWIKMVKDFGTLTFQTGGLNGNAANDLGGQCDMNGNAGVKFESTSLVEGLNLTVVLNDNAVVDKDADGKVIKDYGDFYNYLLKGVYTADALTIGAGYQAHTVPDLNKANNVKDAMAVWGSYKIGDSVTVGAEYASRPNVTNPFNTVVGATSILVKASYVTDALTVNGSFTNKTYGFFTKETAKYADDADKFTESDIFEYSPNVEGYLVKVDASYKLTDALSVNGNVQTVGGKVSGFDITQNNMSYKVGASYQVSEKLGTEAWYKSIGDTAPFPKSQIGLKATYAFVAGLDGSIELDSDTENNVNSNSYTVKLKATL